VDGYHGRGEGDGLVFAVLGVGQLVQQVLEERPFVPVRGDQLPVPERGNGLHQLIPGPGRFPVPQVMVENQERRVPDRCQWFLHRFRQAVRHLPQDPLVVGEDDVLFGAELTKEGAAAHACGVRKVVNGRCVIALPRQQPDRCGGGRVGMAAWRV
jgi:hypothetical protein